MTDDDNFIERSDGEIGTVAIFPDDKCNYLGCILWDMRSRANLRKPFTPRPKPQYTGSPGEATQTIPKTCIIGKRRHYSNTIMQGIFQLHRNGVSPKAISNMIGVPYPDVIKVMSKKTETSSREFMRVCQQAVNPSTSEIIRRLAQEAQHDYGSNSKVV